MPNQPFHASLKEAQEQCKSFYEENGQLRNCTCGTCPTTPPPTDGWVLENGFELHLGGSIFRFADMDSLQKCSRFIQQQEENWKIAIRKTLATQKKELREKVMNIKRAVEQTAFKTPHTDAVVGVLENVLALLTQEDDHA